MKAILTVGCSASGKTTWSENKEYQFSDTPIGYTIICRDDFRKKILIDHFGEETVNTTNIWSLWKSNKSREKLVTEMVDAKLNHCVLAKQNIIVSDCHTNPKTRQKTIEKLTQLGYDVELKFFPIGFIEACERDEKRKDSVGRKTIYKQIEMFNQSFDIGKKYHPDVTKPEAIIVDIDGTLAHSNGMRGTFEFDKAINDTLDQTVFDIIHLFRFVNGYKIVVCTGRGAEYYDYTVEWLSKNGIVYDELFTRNFNDSRKDSIIKEEIFWDKIAPNYQVKFCIDDRKQVIRMWESLGLKVINVGKVDEEF